MNGPASCLLVTILALVLAGFTTGQNATDAEQKAGTLYKGKTRSLTEKKLRERLLEKYQKAIMPNANNSQVFMVKTDLVLIGIQEVDVRNQRIHVTGWFKMEWTDQRLTWNFSDNAGLQSLPVNQEDIYLPEILLFNRYRVRNTEMFGASMAVVYFHGEVIWMPAASLEVPCKMDMKAWPYDVHECVFIFGHASRDNSTFEMYPISTTVSMESFAQSEVEWTVETSRTERFQYYNNVGDGYDNVRFYVTIRRNTLPYLRSIFLAPQILLLASVVIIWISDVNFRILYATGELAASLIFSACFWTVIPPAHSPSNFAYLLAGSPVLIILALFLSVVLDAFGACTGPYPAWLRVFASPCSTSCTRRRLLSRANSSNTYSVNSFAVSTEELLLADSSSPVVKNDNNGKWACFARTMRLLIFVLYSLTCSFLALLTFVL